MDAIYHCSIPDHGGGGMCVTPSVEHICRASYSGARGGMPKSTPAGTPAAVHQLPPDLHLFLSHPGYELETSCPPLSCPPHPCFYSISLSESLPSTLLPETTPSIGLLDVPAPDARVDQYMQGNLTWSTPSSHLLLQCSSSGGAYGHAFPKASKVIISCPLPFRHNDLPLKLRWFFQNKLSKIDLKTLNSTATNIEKLQAGHVGAQVGVGGIHTCAL